MKKSCLTFLCLWAIPFFFACKQTTGEGETGKDSLATEKSLPGDDSDIIRNRERGEVVLLKSKEFSEPQKVFLASVGAPPSEWLNAGDTLDLVDTASHEPVKVIIRAKFGTY